jgi:glyoxylase-like metal-dependent hydrolase (beta-lactamase superfamily II)
MKVRVRMYRQGLGDCFLLSFGKPEAEQVHVLIDCGVLVGTENARDQVTACVKDIHKTTGGRLDVVVATHEHWDHVSGFVQARDVFDQFDFGQIWMAWTEAPGDDQADRLRDDRNKRKQALAAAVELWRGKAAAAPASDARDPSAIGTRIGMTESVLSFFGEGIVGGGDVGLAATDVAGGALGAAPRTTAEALQYLKNRKEAKHYLEPGSTIQLPRLRDVRAYVLGPPRDESMLKKSRPSKRTPETYAHDEAALTLGASFFAAVDRAASGGAICPLSRDALAYPFDTFYRLEGPALESHAFYHANYLSSPPWRRIDHDWLGTTTDLALALDSDTNNTSLVLAFELGEDGDVLLFPADAQIGNWLSWKDLSFDLRSERARRKVSAQDLLARTRLYKVGHHASHNATLREHGLEKMTHDGLMAMIPVDFRMAERQGWAMPFAPLLERLHEKCRGRVLRLDDGEPDGRRLRRLDPAEQQSFKRRVRTTDLYVELTIGS